MPELPEVEAVAAKLRQMTLAARISGVHVLRPGMTRPQDPGEFRRRVTGRQILAVERRAKNLILTLDRSLFLRGHLGMTGNFYVVQDPTQAPGTCRIRLDLLDGRALILDDPRTFGRLTIHREQEREALFAGIGVEPLGPDFTPEVLAEQARQSRSPAKTFLLDQSRIAGLGNIWAAESLWLGRIHPAKPMNQLTQRQVIRLHAAIVTTLTRAVESALAIYQKPSVFPDAESIGLDVYGRHGEPCRRCRRPIRRFQQAGRSSYFCPRCQTPSPASEAVA
jgi:formamidopyrimidine-DNA glycosylase